MKKTRLLLLLLAVLMVLVYLPGRAQAVSGSEKCYVYTPQMTENTFRYLQEMYIEKYPQMGLRWTTGTESDRQALIRLADVITEGCTTDGQKASAIAGWVKRNIEYVEETPLFYAADVFGYRKGNCASYAQLMLTLLRLEGIPATWGDGFRMDTQSVTVSQMQTLEAGHAWCFACIDGQWTLYDPLYEGEKGITDRDYIAKHYFLDTVDQITPAYDSSAMPPARTPETVVAYVDGRFMHYSDGLVDTEVGNFSIGVNRSGYYSFAKTLYYYDDPRGAQPYTYLEDPDRVKDMIPGQIYAGGWIGGGGIPEQLAWENGAQANGIVVEHQGQRLLAEHSKLWKFFLEEGQYRLTNGYLCLAPDFSGKIVEPVSYADYLSNPNLEVVWTSEFPEYASVDQNGVVTLTGQEGIGLVSVTVINKDSGTHVLHTSIWLHIYPEERVFDYSDRAPSGSEHTCEYHPTQTVPPSCEEQGYTLYECACGNSYQADFVGQATGHVFDPWLIDRLPTATEEGVRVRFCSVCGQGEVDFIPPGTDVSTLPTVPAEPIPTNPSQGGDHTCQWQAVEVVEPWCEEDGFTVYVCTVCGNEKLDDYKAGGHTFGPWETQQEPEGEIPGYRIRVCENCGYTEEQMYSQSGETIPPLQDPTLGPTQGPTQDPIQGTTTQPPEKEWELVRDPDGSGITVRFPGADPEQLEGVRVAVDLLTGDAGAQAREHLQMQDKELEQTKIFDISLEASGVKIQPDGRVTVSIPIPQGWNAGNLVVYYIAEDGDITDMQARISADGRNVEFDTDHFSCYALAQRSSQAAQPNSQSSAELLIWILVGAGALAVLAVGGLLLWKKPWKKK